MNENQQKIIFSNNLKKFVNKANLPQNEIAKRIGVSPQTFNTWIKGIAIPRMGKIQKLADYFNIEKSDLIEIKPETLTTETDNKILNTVRQLKEPRKLKVLDFAEQELEAQDDIINYNIIYAVSSAAAGVGYSYDVNDIEKFYTDEELPKYDYATVVAGDSMHPKFSNGDIVLIRSGYDNVNGEIYVIDYNGKSYIKKLYNEGTHFRLKSINPKYEDIIIYISEIEDTYFNIVGKVIKSITPIEV